jgi:hypothetical protein
VKQLTFQGQAPSPSSGFLMMGMELVPETSIFNKLTWLIAREDFIDVSRCESFRSYNKNKDNVQLKD